MNFDWKNLLDKAWWSSKTIWFNTFFTAFGSFIIFIEPLVHMLPEATAVSVMGYLMVFQSFGNKILRFLTKHGLIPGKQLEAQKIEVDKVVAITAAIGDVPTEDLPALKEAAAQIKLQKQVTAAQDLLKSVKLAQEEPADPK